MIGVRAHAALFVVLVALMAAVIVFIPQWGWRLRAMLSPSVPENVQNLTAENETLEAQLAQYQVVAAQLPHGLPNYTRAMVYARYPTNFRSELLIDAGAQDGIAVGNAVVIETATSSYVLIGRIQSVTNGTAVVQTVFDPALRMPVRVGSQGYDGLLVGGVDPVVTSVLKSATVQAGDIVVSADASLPYGLPIAEVGSVGVTSDNLFQRASLTFAYDINGVETVLVAQ